MKTKRPRIKTEFFCLRMTPAERRQVQAAAKRLDLTMSQVVMRGVRLILQERGNA